MHHDDTPDYDDNTTPETGADKPARKKRETYRELPMPIEPDDDGSNWAVSPQALADDLRTLGLFYGKVLERAEKDKRLLFDLMVAFGVRLLRAKRRYPATKEFGQWIRDEGLDTIPVLGTDKGERNSCMVIAQLVTEGAVFEEGAPPVKLTLEELYTCNWLKPPSNVRKWLAAHRDFGKLIRYRDGPAEAMMRAKMRTPLPGGAKKLSETDQLKARLIEARETIAQLEDNRHERVVGARTAFAEELAGEHGQETALRFLQPLYDEGGTDALSVIARGLIAILAREGGAEMLQDLADTIATALESLEDEEDESGDSPVEGIEEEDEQTAP